jgi:hypothetical protein
MEPELLAESLSEDDTDATNEKYETNSVSGEFDQRT